MKDWMTTQDVEMLAEDALNQAVRVIQDKLGITDGFNASIYFSDDKVKTILTDYIMDEIFMEKILFANDDNSEPRYLNQGE